MRHRVLAPLLVAAFPATLVAQTQRSRAFAGAEFYTVSFAQGSGTKSVSEFAVPLGIAIPIGPRFSLDAGTYFVRAERTDEQGGSATISGPTDLTVRAGYQLVPDAVAFTVAANLPTGQATLDNQQITLAGTTATDLIPFPVTSFGSGFNVTSGLAVATPVRGWALGAAGSYRYNGEYTPVQDTGTATVATLKPGGEFRLRVGADRIVGQGRVSFGLTYSTFSRDEFGADQVNGGRRFISQASWSFPVGHHNVSLFAWDVARSADSAEVSTCPFASCAKARENTVAIGAITSLRVGRNLLRPALEFRHAWRAEGEGALANYGTLFSIGARYQVQASDRFTIVPGLRFDTGSTVPAPGTAVGFTGLSASVTVRANL